MNNTTQQSPLRSAIALFPTLQAFADEVGQKYQTVQQWERNGVPVEHCVAVEKATKGKVTRKDLRPDDWKSIWPELAD
jgi:DNA-binding transcriptional regulator YdaS (Cro superfamily)